MSNMETIQKDDVKSKVSDIFFEPGLLVDKTIASLTDQFRKIPRFVVDYLISRMVDADDPGPGLKQIEQLIRERFVEADQKEWIKSKIRESGEYNIICNVRCRYDQAKDEYWVEISELGDNFIRVTDEVITKYQDTLLTTGSWGTACIAFDPRYVIRGRIYPFVLVDFVPLQITDISVDLWVERRESFSDDEWIDLMVRSVGFEPSRLSEEEKMLYMIRLIPFVESNVNMVELGPPETGKTFNYRMLSSYGFVVSGATSTVASLFYNKLRRKVGVIGYRDCVMFDEIGSAQWNGQEDLANMMKDFMNNGRFGRDTTEFASECSIVFAGNIDCDRKLKCVKGYYRSLFDPFPKLVSRDRAFLDRIHGFIPGWQIPQIAEANFANGIGFMCDYLSEIMHLIRSRNYGHIVLAKVDFSDMTQRNQTAIVRMASGLLKLLYPHRTLETITEEEIRRVMDISTSLRQRVVDQLAKIMPTEFGNVKLTYLIK